jgi:hypothetical protein
VHHGNESLQFGRRRAVPQILKGVAARRRGRAQVGGGGSIRRDARNGLAAEAAVDAEVAVGREEDGVGQNLGHADEAGVGEAHRHVGILAQQREENLSRYLYSGIWTRPCFELQCSSKETT